MKKIVNQEQLRKEWVIESWYEKGLYILGWATFIWCALAFLVGFIGALVK